MNPMLALAFPIINVCVCVGKAVGLLSVSVNIREMNVKLTEGMSNLPLHCLAFQCKCSNGHQMTVTIHAFVVPFFSRNVHADRLNWTLNIRLNHGCKISQD